MNKYRVLETSDERGTHWWIQRLEYIANGNERWVFEWPNWSEHCDKEGQIERCKLLNNPPPPPKRTERVIYP